MATGRGRKPQRSPRFESTLQWRNTSRCWRSECHRARWRRRWRKTKCHPRSSRSLRLVQMEEVRALVIATMAKCPQGVYSFTRISASLVLGTDDGCDARVVHIDMFSLVIRKSRSRGQFQRRDSTFRKVHWTSLESKKADDTIWARVTSRRRTAPIKLSPQDFQELEDLFGISQTSSTTTADGSAACSNRRKQKIHPALDPRRSNNISIGLSQFKSIGGVDAILRAVSECDLDFLTPERLETLQEIAPTTIEAKRYSDFRGSRSRLEPAELFLVQMCEIPRVTEKVRLSFVDIRVEYCGPHCGAVADSSSRMWFRLARSCSRRSLSISGKSLQRASQPSRRLATRYCRARGLRVALSSFSRSAICSTLARSSRIPTASRFRHYSRLACGDCVR